MLVQDNPEPRLQLSVSNMKVDMITTGCTQLVR